MKCFVFPLSYLKLSLTLLQQKKNIGDFVSFSPLSKNSHTFLNSFSPHGEKDILYFSYTLKLKVSSL